MGTGGGLIKHSPLKLWEGRIVGRMAHDFDINSAVDEIRHDVIEWRHHLHRNPELSNREKETSEFIIDKLREFGFDDESLTTGVAGYGIVAVLRGGAEKTGRNMLLRADIDALPVQDKSGVDFASEKTMDDGVNGTKPVSHACGHDCHTAMLLGAAKILHDTASDLPGDVTFVFQPAEEGPPGDELGGASEMIKDDALTSLSPRPTMAFGMHVGSGPKGLIAYTRGTQHAASERVSVEFTGNGVHGSTPWMGADPMPAAGAFLSGYQQIYRNLEASQVYAITFGHLVDTGRFNVVPETVRIEGTVRALEDAVMDEINEWIERLAKGFAAAYRVEANVEFSQYIPPVINTEEWVEAIRPSLLKVAGNEEKVIEVPSSLGYDDVSEFTQAYGGIYALLGVQDVIIKDGQPVPEEGGRGLAPNHNPKFYADDDAILEGVKLHVQVTLDHLSGKCVVEDAD